MTQIIEFSKHSDNYLIHHFEFECNDKTAIGQFTGNCSLNKFMSLDDWIKIFDDLNDSVQRYVSSPHKRPASAVRRIGDTHFELNSSWVDMDATFYSKLLTSIDFQNVFPFVIKLKVNLRSNLDKFTPEEMILSPAVKERTVTRKMTIEKSVKTLSVSLTNGAVYKTPIPIPLKECYVRLPQLQFNEYGEVIQREAIRNKRKRSSIDTSVMRSLRVSPKNQDASIFMCSSSSTPFVRNIDAELNRIDAHVRGTFKSVRQTVETKRLTTRLTTTPRSSNTRKTSGSQFNPRIRLLNVPADVNKSSSANKSILANKSNLANKSSAAIKSKSKNTGKMTGKKVSKSKAKPKVKANKKQTKAKVQSLANESELFEAQENRPVVKPIKKPERKMPLPKIMDIVKIEPMDLTSLTEDSLWKSFAEHQQLISNHFDSYLKQTSPTVQKSSDYNHFDIISLLTTDQFSVMLDILFEKLVKIGEFGDICYDALFLELLVPEWILAIFMQIYSLDRKSAIVTINTQKSNRNQSFEGYTTIMTSKLDDTMNGY